MNLQDTLLAFGEWLDSEGLMAPYQGDTQTGRTYDDLASDFIAWWKSNPDRAPLAGSHGLKVYIAGPMTGYVDHNFPAFHAAAARLRALGYTVVNPAEMDEGLSAEELREIPHEVFMRRDIRALVDCDAIYFLPGWKHSKGATGEKAVADLCGIVEILDPNVEVWRTFEGEPLPEPITFFEAGSIAGSIVVPLDNGTLRLTSEGIEFEPHEEEPEDECPAFHTFVQPCKLAKPEPIVHHVVKGERPNVSFIGVENAEGLYEVRPNVPAFADAEPGLNVVTPGRSLRIVETEEQAADELAAQRILAAADRLQAEGPDEFPRGYYIHLAQQAEAEKRANEDEALGDFAPEYRRLQEGLARDADPDGPQPGDAFPNVAYVRHMTGKTSTELIRDAFESEQFERGVE